MAPTAPAHGAGAPRWPHRLAVLTAGVTLLLIVVGGLVTNTGSALAVPDWPTTFGYNMFLYPWSQMVGGVLYEHSHRLLGSAVGMLTIALVVALWATDRRRSVRWLALGALAGVVVQGVVGGLRVVLLDNQLAIVHGCLAQAFFALVIGLAVCTSAWWTEAAALPADPGIARLRRFAVVTAGLVYLQLVFGSVLTHTAKRLDAHLGFAALSSLAIVGVTHIVLRRSRESGLRRPSLALLALLAVQLGLGVGVYLWRFTRVSVLMPPVLGLLLETAHRLTGAVLWATTVLLALRIARRGGARQENARRAAAAPVLAGDPPRRVVA